MQDPLVAEGWGCGGGGAEPFLRQTLAPPTASHAGGYLFKVTSGALSLQL